MQVRNCILRDGGGAELSGRGLDVSYSNVEGGFPGPGNIDADPVFLGGPSGAWTGSPSFDPLTGQTTLADAGASFVPGELVGEVIVPTDRIPQLRATIAGNTGTEISIVGDHWAAIVGAGDAYEVSNVRLSPGSPCVDAGHNWGVPQDSADLDGDGNTRELTPLDLDGLPRFVDDPGFGADSGCGEPAIVDMGAYEEPSIGTAAEIIFGDVDGDGAVGIEDLLELLSAWGPAGKDCELADLDLDGEVGNADLLALLAGWS